MNAVSEVGTRLHTEIIDDDSYRQLIASALSALSHYFVGFALPTTGSNEFDAHLGGSGTLITIDDVQGILTADHVISLLRSRQHVGLIFPSEIHRDLHHIEFSMVDSRYFSLPGRGEPSVGPDLGIIIPPLQTMAALSARKSFYNLSKRRSAALSNAPPPDRGMWALSGFPNDWTRDAPVDGNFARIKVFQGGLSVGIAPKQYELGNYDYLSFPALYNTKYEGPESYEGVSGGSLWQILVAHDGARWRTTDFLLSGVAFFQSGKEDRKEGTVREIVCHGRKTLYGSFIEHMRERLAVN
jgi:hypothetical protein